MKNDCINSLITFIKKSNDFDFNSDSVYIRTAEYNVDKGYTVLLDFKDEIYFNRTLLSENWVAENLFLFTTFDLYLENKYNLTEGVAFKKHYCELPEKSTLEIISKNCYRILKIIRNTIQHNLSSINYDKGNYNIDYKYKNTSYKLCIDKDGVRNLYRLIMNIIQEKISGLDYKYNTIGHYEEIICMEYLDMLDRIQEISDDIKDGLLFHNYETKLKFYERYHLKNPIILKQTEEDITFEYFKGSKNSSTDYIYNYFLLPEEIGKISENKETITFKNSHLLNKWKIKI